MDCNADYIKLVKEAQLSDEKSLNRLAELARPRLRVYVYRLTLAEDLTQDIVQETILEMYKIFGKLKSADRFWPWLYGIAFNKIRRHHRTERHEKKLTMAYAKHADTAKDKQEALQNLISQELKEIVSVAMRCLKTSHRAILTMRCYDGMSYSEIAESMDCSEFGARMLFSRAKRSLAKQLARRGLSKGALLTALVLFGKMTAPSEAAAASMSVTAATVKTGAAAALAAAVTSKTVVVSLITAGVIGAGTVTVAPSVNKIAIGPRKSIAKTFFNAQHPAKARQQGAECWYYYPEKPGQTVMMRLVKSDPGGNNSYCHRLQNDQANYYFNDRQGTVYIENSRMWAGDLSVWRLPGDDAKLTDFLSQAEGQEKQVGYLSSEERNLLVVVKQDRNQGSMLTQIARHLNVLDEEYFRYNWPLGTKVVDNRDTMHRRGWTYFRVEGQIRDKEVTGTGRLPFVYAAAKQNWPWFRLKVGDQSKTTTNFAGLPRPWMGLHTIDTVRRDAAAQQLWFETELLADDKARVTLTHNSGKIIYTIDTEADVVDKIEFLTDGQKQGELRFSYLQDIDGAGSEFTEPNKRTYRRSQQNNPGILWLVRLAKG